MILLSLHFYLIIQRGNTALGQSAKKWKCLSPKSIASKRVLSITRIRTHSPEKSRPIKCVLKNKERKKAIVQNLKHRKER